MRGEWTDNMTYGATADEWRAWTDRPQDPPAELRLVPLTLENNQDYYALRTHHSEERFVAPMSWSFADALFPRWSTAPRRSCGCTASRPSRGVNDPGHELGVRAWHTGPVLPPVRLPETGEMLDEETLVRLQLGGSNPRGD